MPANKYGFSDIIIHVPETGVEVYVNDVDYSNQVIDYDFSDEINQPGQFTCKLLGCSTSQRNSDLKRGNSIRFQSRGKLLFKGIITRAEYATDTSVVLKGYDSVAYRLKDRVVVGTKSSVGGVSNTNTRPQYDNVSPYTIISEQLANVSGVSVSATASGATLNNVSVRGDNDTILSFASSVVENAGGEWWSEYSGDNFENEFFAFSGARGSSSRVVKSYNTSGASTNASFATQEEDFESLANVIYCHGYGDGVNQKASYAFHATGNRTKLSADLTSGGTVVYVDSTEGFPGYGELWIGVEKARYSSVSGNAFVISGNDAGTYRGYANSVSNVSGAYYHTKGSPVVDASYTEDSPESGSSIAVYGRSDKVIVNKKIFDQSALDKIAESYLEGHNGLVKRITVSPNDPYADDRDLSVGDLLSITDDDSELSSSEYRVFKKSHRFKDGLDEVKLEVSNSGLEFTRAVNETREDSVSMRQYMQGATSSWNVSSYENCDSDVPLELRFYLPEDIIAINKALLSFKVRDYRVFTPQNAENILDMSFDTLYPSGTYPSSWMDCSSFSVNTDVSYYLVNFAVRTTYNGAVLYYFRLKLTKSGETTRYYPSDSSTVTNSGTPLVYYITTNASGNHTGENAYLNIVVPFNCNGWTITPQIASSVNHSSYPIYSNNTGQGVFFNLDTSRSGSNASYSVTIDDDNGNNESTIFPSGSTGNVDSEDISDAIKKIGSGNWVRIRFAPDRNCRIEANAFIKCFIESK